MDVIQNFFKEFHIQIIVTLFIFLAFPLFKYIIKKIVLKYSISIQINEVRTLLMLKHFNVLLNILAVLMLIIIWGVNPKNILLAFSSVFAIIGVAFFAQWSLLSNITAGILIYFTSPFKIGDTIKILDKDIPIEAIVEDIKTIYIHLRTEEGELIVFPNNLILQKSISIVNKKEEH